LKKGTFKRLVYNRVPKAGSSLMDNLIHKLSQRNNFSFVQDTDYLPNASALAERIAALPEGDVYINHAGFDATAPADVAFMNLVREPIDRAVSLFYYGVDPDTRPADRAAECLQNRQDAGACGCAGQEADYCVYSQLGNNFYGGCGEGEAGTQKYCQPFDDLDVGSRQHTGPIRRPCSSARLLKSASIATRTPPRATHESATSSSAWSRSSS
jgi:hypothetical protein